jgi:hypothetical protein
MAPETQVIVGVASELDVYGLTFMGASHFFGKGTFTGPLVVADSLTTYYPSALCCQFPTTLRDYIYSNLSWSEHSVRELEYEEL